ncbi:Histone-lysine N-methyltransferase SETMAR [Habropoda laboriosa]|uniref:Histone-lysine N-methyltransferase SETMAR n=1 Tax=Habropoda laboriosa TaxID=597456 RepID=A0A0L7R4H5_9HYME|nr:Histone-lysine N-methyltransferase SETMAR [Habropoda laboriosa]
MIFHRDNTKPHVTQRVQKELREFGWVIPSHPVYSPDIHPSDYHLFRALRHFLAREKFDNTQSSWKKTPCIFEIGISRNTRT